MKVEVKPIKTSGLKQRRRRLGTFIGLKKEKITSLCFVLPALVLLIVFWIYPMLHALVLSFQKYNLLNGSSTFVGLENYQSLFSDKEFFKSLIHSFYFAVIVIPIQTAIALGLALLIKNKIRGIGIFRAIYFLPVAVSFAVASTIFKLIYNKNYGLLNSLLVSLGIHPIDFLSNPNLAMIGIIILCIWKAVGFFMLVFLAGLNNIPDELYEAAQIDGANALQKFIYITMPMLKRTTAFVVIITTIDAFKVFVPMYITTDGGGPAGSTENLVLFIYEAAFRLLNIGYAAAAACIFFIIVLIISIIQLKYFRADTD
ncbi:carbohydrate ABC transporter permease [Scopulibacillus cellulosilyticus]|uniref:Carbohydrate ABC transporter permease n=1 Tax=Scopulibacillus cellulosilyticus TaxID=2665665 RepID=A0ABW2PYQ9_9BACL